MSFSQSKKAIQLNGVFCTEDLLHKSGGGLFSLVRISMMRALELASGKPSLIEKPSSNKIITTVFEEIIAGKIVFKKKEKV
jgi:DNA-directed RNA polymerase subunit K/omega